MIQSSVAESECVLRTAKYSNFRITERERTDWPGPRYFVVDMLRNGVWWELNRLDRTELRDLLHALSHMLDGEQP